MNDRPMPPIQLVIGADLYSYALRDGLRRGGPGEPVGTLFLVGYSQVILPPLALHPLRRFTLITYRLTQSST